MQGWAGEHLSIGAHTIEIVVYTQSLWHQELNQPLHWSESEREREREREEERERERGREGEREKEKERKREGWHL